MWITSISRPRNLSLQGKSYSISWTPHTEGQVGFKSSPCSAQHGAFERVGGTPLQKPGPDAATPRLSSVCGLCRKTVKQHKSPMLFNSVD